MNTMDKEYLINALAREVDSHNLTKAELADTEKEYKLLLAAFNELLDEFIAKREVLGFSDLGDIRYYYTDKAGLLDRL